MKPAGGGIADRSTEDAQRSDFRSALLWLGSTTLIWQILSWAFTLLTARLLSPSDYGLIALAETLLPYLAILSSCSIAVWIVQTPRAEALEQRAAFWLTTAMGGAVSILAFLLAPLTAKFYANGELIFPLRIISLCFFFDGMQITPKAMLRRQMRFKALSLMNLSIAVSRSLLQLLLAYLGYGYMALVAGILFRSIVEAIWVHKLNPVPMGFVWDSALFRRIFSFGIPATGSTLCWVVFCTADKLLIGRLFGVEALGFYALAFYLSDLPMSKMSMILKPVVLAHYSRAKSDPARLGEEFMKVTRGSLLLMHPILIGIAVAAPQGVPLLLGAKWSPMVPALQALCIVGMIRCLCDCISPLLLAAGEAKRELSINISSALLMPPLFYLMGRSFGIEGVYCAWLGFLPLVVVIAVRMLEKTLGIAPLTFLRGIWYPAATALCMAGAARAAEASVADASDIEILALKLAALGVVYLGFMFRYREGLLRIYRETRGKEASTAKPLEAATV